MQRGYFNFPFPTGKTVVQQVVASAGSFSTISGNGAMKASIILFDSRPGTRTFTPSATMIARVFVVGAGACGGGGYTEKVMTLQAGIPYSYTVGAAGGVADGGTSSFAAILSATGGKGQTNGGAGGTGSGGDVNTSGGAGPGGASGHRFGNGSGFGGNCGAGWSGSGSVGSGGSGGVDGWGLGMVPGRGGGNSAGDICGGYGAGGGTTTTGGGSGGMGGGGGCSYPASNVPGGYGGLGGGGGQNLGGSGSPQYPGGNGVVGIEVIG